MKRLLTFIFTICLIQVQAQSKKFTINGKILNDDSLKYVFVLNNNNELLKKVEIKDGKFTINSEYLEDQRYGAPAYALLVFTKPGEIEPKSYPSSFKHFHYKVILGEPVELTYIGGKQKKFIIESGEKNSIQQQFENVYWRYRNKRDSLYLTIDNSTLGIIDKNDQKVEIHHELYRIAINETISIVNNYRNSEIALTNFGPIIYSQYVSGQIALEMFNNFSKELKNSPYGIHLYKDLEDKITAEEEMNSPSFTIGMMMPAFELPNHQGVLIKNTNVFKKYTLIDFWATWCLPCRNETPNIISAFENYHQKGFNVITISVDELAEHAKWLATLKSDKMDKFTNLISDQSKSRLVKQLKINAIPANYLVDETGKIVAVNLRGENLQNKLKELLP